MKRRTYAMVIVAGLAAAMLVPASMAGAHAQRVATAKPASASCGKFSGTVVLTYTNPDTIILHIIKGKVNAATTFTMSPSTTYLHNGTPATFADIKIGDVGTITATEQLPSGVLLACSVVVTGP
jgi:hypothetical protein